MANPKATTNPLEEIQKLRSIEQEIEKLTGKAAGGRGRRSADTPAKRSLTFQELKDSLLATPSRTLSIRKQGLDVTNIRTLANINPRDLVLGGKGPWPTVTYIGK
jgi:hypothetical protein